MKSFLIKGVYVLSAILIIWVLVSWINVLQNNSIFNEDKQYWAWNCFVLVQKLKIGGLTW